MYNKDLTLVPSPSKTRQLARLKYMYQFIFSLFTLPWNELHDNRVAPSSKDRIYFVERDLLSPRRVWYENRYEKLRYGVKMAYYDKSSTNAISRISWRATYDCHAGGKQPLGLNSPLLRSKVHFSIIILRVFVSTPLTSLSLLLLYFHVGEIAFNTGNWYVKDTLYMSGMACVYSILLLSLIDAQQHAVHHFTVRSFLGSSTMFDHWIWPLIHRFVPRW